MYVAGVEHFAGQRERKMDVASFLKELTIAREYFASKLCFWKYLRNSSDVIAIIMTSFVFYIESRQTNPTMYYCIPVASLCVLNKKFKKIYNINIYRKSKRRRDTGLLLCTFMLQDILHIQFSLFSFGIKN